MRPVILLAAYTGMRRGELAGLRRPTWTSTSNSDQGHRAGRRAVRHTLHVGKPKTDRTACGLSASTRTPWPSCGQFGSDRPSSASPSVKVWEDTDRVFTCRDGASHSPGSWYTHQFWGREATGARAARFHDLRHFPRLGAEQYATRPNEATRGIPGSGPGDLVLNFSGEDRVRINGGAFGIGGSLDGDELANRDADMPRQRAASLILREATRRSGSMPTEPGWRRR